MSSGLLNEAILAGGPLSESYTYDSQGRLSTKTGMGTYTYLDPKHVDAVTHLNGVQKYWYDANGNQTKRTVGSDSYDLQYDAENRLVEAQQNGAVIATFKYDGEGRRVQGTLGGVTTAYLGDYYEWTSNGASTRYYYHGATRLALRRSGYSASNGLYWLLGDHLASTAVLATSGGTLSASSKYKPWGETRAASGSLLTSFRYTGQRQQAEIGLYYYGARWYDAYLAQFTQPDSIIPDPYNMLDWNRYAYARYNPVKNVDPSGHRTCTANEAATGDETCNQNYNADDLKKSLSFLYGWTVAGEWTVEDLVVIAAAGKSIREFVAKNNGVDGNIWIKIHLGNAVFYPGNKERSFVFPAQDIYLINGVNHYVVVHELAHVLDNNFKGGDMPATFFAGGAADAMLKFVGGNPEKCFPRFQCSNSYVKNIAGPEAWKAREYGNNSVADDFAETFAQVITGGTAPSLRSMWMKAFLGVIASYLP